MNDYYPLKSPTFIDPSSEHIIHLLLRESFHQLFNHRLVVKIIFIIVLSSDEIMCIL